MKGWKTLTGGIGFILVGVYQVTDGKLYEGLNSILLGLSIIGIGHKIDKKL